MVQRLSVHGADAAHAQLMLSGALAQVVTRQALTEAFQDTFWLLSALFVLGLLIVPFAKTPPLTNELPPEAH